MLQQTKLCVCVCVCGRGGERGGGERERDCLCVSMHYKIKSHFKRNYGKILNISAYISPIRLRNVAGELAGTRLRVSGWGRTSDSEYNRLII
jgi:hypothetical protein